MKYSQLGTYWERGNSNEIDLVAINSLDKKAVLAEVKVNRSKIDLDILANKSTGLLQQLPGYEVEYKALSLEEM
jgi:uncharacterized protein